MKAINSTFKQMVAEVPADVKIDAEKAQKWLANGAQPTETVKSLLKKSGIVK